MRKLTTLFFAGLLSMGLAASIGCAGDAHDGEEEELALEFGLGGGENYRVLEDGAVCDVVYSTQGGYFLMVVLKSNIAPQDLVSCGIWVGDQLVANNSVRILESEATDTPIGFLMLAMPGEPEVAELDGRSGLLYCEFAEAYFEVNVTLDVTLLGDTDSSRRVETFSSQDFAQQP